VTNFYSSKISLNSFESESDYLQFLGPVKWVKKNIKTPIELELGEAIAIEYKSTLIGDQYENQLNRFRKTNKKAKITLNTSYGNIDFELDFIKKNGWSTPSLLFLK
jgi:hypothetical protein